MSEPYMPSNGSEGEMFDEVFCSRCLRDRKYRETQDAEDGCPILAQALAGDPPPPEWIWEGLDADGILVIGEGAARCTAFEPIPPDHVDVARELSEEEKAAQGSLL